MNAKRETVYVGLILVLMVLVIGMAVQNYDLFEELTGTKAVADQLAKKDMDSEVVRSISKQLEEIAFQQKDLSDLRREEAEQQAEIAQSMRQQAETEQLRAQESEQRAVSALNQAEQDRKIAEEQRRIAENEREAAVQAKNETNQFRLISLGRNLATLAVSQFQANNKDLARTLAYAAWHFTSTNGGNTYTSELFEALTLLGGGTVSSKEHKAGISAIRTYAKDKNTTIILSVGRYGEIVSTQVNNADNKLLKSKTLFSDNKYDFRDIYQDEEYNIYALSKDGSAVKLTPAGHKTILPALPEAIQSKTKYASKITDQKIVCSTNEFIAEGNANGELTITHRKTGETKKLLGHSSAITGLTFVRNSLFSCSLDGTLKIWNLESAVINPVTLLNNNSWIFDMEKSADERTLWLGCGDGTLVGILINPTQLVDRLKQQMTRELTQQEWKEYVGEDVPYMYFLSEKQP
ncbi:MAG: hypothetical protein HUJ99_04565 [Bacteroidaceae bacterium]|nr:hypothetical protein [Bacteroidaceae bacterium]